MDITFIGAARTVTGSLHLFEYKKQKFLVECGLYQGHRAEAERINRTFPFKPKDVKAVVLSHAHVDHAGNLPTLAHRGFSGPVYCTGATKDIASLLLRDAARLHEHDIAYLNKKQAKQGLPAKEPLYTARDVETMLHQFTTVEYKQPFQPVSGVHVTLYDAGHILGSAIILIEVNGTRILFSGDLGRKQMPIIKDPTIIPDIDYLILESTYGGTAHKSFEMMTDELRAIVEQGKKSKSKIIIPAFAVERTQVLVTILKTLHDEGILAHVPVYIDSPLATDVTLVFRKHPECFDTETYALFADGDPFNFPGLHYITAPEDSKALNGQQGPMIIIAASGMCEGGRVVHHLMHAVEHDSNIVVMTGFQARGTLGHRILAGEKTIIIFNDPYEVRAQVYFMGGLSAHADGNELFDYVKQMNRRLKKVYLIHGDIEEARVLQEKIETHSMIDVDIPESLTHVII